MNRLNYLIIKNLPDLLPSREGSSENRRDRSLICQEIKDLFH